MKFNFYTSSDHTLFSVFLMLSLFLLSMCDTSTQKNADTTIYHNVKGYTFANDELVDFEALVFGSGKIIEVGSSDELLAAYPDAQKMDGRGNVMLPGLIDAHGHVMGLGYQQLYVDVSGAASLDEAISKVRDYAAEHPELPWIKGRGWNQTHWEGNRFPTAGDLDAVITERPVWLERVDGHAGWANSKALEMAGITAATREPEDGDIITGQDGQPTGIFIDAAMQLVEEHIPEPTKKEKEQALTLAIDKAQSVGLTATHDAGIGPDIWKLYNNFAQKNKLGFRIYAMIGGTGEAFDQLSDGGPIEHAADHMLSLRSVKIYNDGALGSRGAALLEEYSDDHGNNGLLFHNREELVLKIKKAASKGYQVNIHAIGDRANRVVLDAFEEAQTPRQRATLRHRIEHAQIVAPEDIPRFAQLDVIASMQPTHATSDMNMAGDRLGEAQLEGAYAWQTMLDAGVHLASGSDYPVESPNPFWGLYSAVTRQNHNGEPAGGWRPQEKLTRQQALKSFTIDAAYAGFMEEITGSLEPGKYADFVIIDCDYFEIPYSEIYQIDVLETWVAGKKVFHKNNS